MSDYWEYKTIDYTETTTFSGSLKAQPLEALLNEHGRVGWELVSAVPNVSFHTSKGLVLILRRRR